MVVVSDPGRRSCPSRECRDGCVSVSPSLGSVGPVVEPIGRLVWSVGRSFDMSVVRSVGEVVDVGAI